MDSESNRVTSWQRGVRFATIPTNFLLTHLVGSIIGHPDHQSTLPASEATAKLRPNQDIGRGHSPKAACRNRAAANTVSSRHGRPVS